MIEGLLRPRSDESRPWLMPVMRASRGALHGGRRQLYPKKAIWVDPAAEAGGDGSALKPLKSMDAVISDDTLECVCQALCCDKYTVRVNGPISVTTDDTVTTGAEDVITLVHGHGRDYARRLVIRPWTRGGRLALKATLRTHITVSETNQVDFAQYAIIVKALRGVMWVDTDISIDLVIVCDREPEDIRINAFAELGGWDECADSIFMNCTVTVRTRVDVLMKIPYQGDYNPPAPGGGGGGGGGTYPWPTPPDTPGGGGPYPWPGEPQPIPTPSPWTGGWNAATVVFGIRDSSCAIARGGTLDLVAKAQSNWGALAECRGVVNCPGSDLAGMTIKTASLAEASGSGAAYTNDDGSSGIAGYGLTAVAHARDVAHCRGAALNALLGVSSANASAIAGNQPHHLDAAGQRTDYAVGGYALAEDYGVFGCRDAIAAALDHTVSAKASHPEHYGQRACPYVGNIDATFSACAGAGGQCRSNHAGWCVDAGDCDAV